MSASACPPSQTNAHSARLSPHAPTALRAPDHTPCCARRLAAGFAATRPSALALALALALTLGLGIAHAADPAKSGKAAKGTKTTAKAVKATPPAAAQRAREPEPVAYGRREDVMRFAADVAQRHKLPPSWVEATLAEARLLPTVARLIMPPPVGSTKNWAAYRARFVEPVRLAAGLAYWERNADWLEAAEAQFGVPAAIIMGIIGVETLYGRHMGNFRVLDALATLSFDFPVGRRDRSEFFQSELESYLLLTHRDGLDAKSITGSYAGAIGMPQFMPSSILRYAVDFDRDGRIDLYRSSADVIGSVGNYLASFDWQRGMPTHYAAAAPTDTRARALLLAPDIVPSFSAAELVEHGAWIDEAARRHAGKLALVELQNGDAAPTFVAGTDNFYTVTRYNWSSYYALAVIELGAALAERRGAR